MGMTFRMTPLCHSKRSMPSKEETSGGGMSPPSNIDKENLMSSAFTLETQTSTWSLSFTGKRSPSNFMFSALTLVGPSSSPSSSHVIMNDPSLFCLSTVASYHSSSSSKRAVTRSPGSKRGASADRGGIFMPVVCRSPSRTAPTSMKAPKLAILMTMPLNFCPFFISVNSNFGTVFRIPSSGEHVCSSPSSSQTSVTVPSPLSLWMMPSYHSPSSTYKARTASPGSNGPLGSTLEMALRM
mmetsp:Transcript_87399/g.267417  ORF Transcript_87399/g.267417 Transcript_87399/m.267417 type:complete len:240 (-) Transcript_87399:865-1584(-)